MIWAALCAVLAVLAAWPWWRGEPAALRYGLAAVYAASAVAALILHRHLRRQS